MADELTKEVNNVLAELREMFPRVHLPLLKVRRHNTWVAEGKDGLVWSVEVGSLTRQAPTLSEAMAQVRSWKAAQDADGER